MTISNDQIQRIRRVAEQLKDERMVNVCLVALHHFDGPTKEAARVHVQRFVQKIKQGNKR